MSTRLTHDANVVPHGLPQFQAGLLLDAPQGADRDVGIGMWHRHEAAPLRMFELAQSPRTGPHLFLS